METLLKDLRYAIRGLLRTPAFTIPLVITLALGLGANTAVWSVLGTVLLRPLPYPQPDRLVRVYELMPWAGGGGPHGKGWGSVSTPNLRDWQEQTGSFTALAPWSSGNVNLLGSGDPERLLVLQAGDALFPTVGVSALLGRTLQQGDADPNRPLVAVLSYALWQRRFAGDAAVVGRTLKLGGGDATVVGVMPPAFTFPPSGSPVDLYMPLQPDAKLDAERGSHWLNVVARLRPGVTVAAAQAEMERVTARLAEQFPDEQRERSAWVKPLHEDTVGPVRPKLMVVAAAAALVLLIACANAASLLLARAVARRRELGVRAALGASQSRLARQLVAEALLVALAGAAVGLLLAPPTIQLLMTLAKGSVPGGGAAGFDGRVFAVLLLACAATALLTALAPVLHLRRTALREELQAGSSRTGGDRGARSMRSALVIAQVALSTVLLVGTGLLLKSLAAIMAVNPGIATEQVVALRVGTLPDAQRIALYERLRERVDALPGVVAAGWTSHVPLRDWGTNGNFSIAGIADAADPADQPRAELRWISPGYFDALAVPVLRGRAVQPADLQPGAPPVAVVNQALVDEFFHGKEPLGREIRNLFDQPVRVVGVVRSFHQTRLDQDPLPELYAPLSNNAPKGMAFVVRAQRRAEEVLPEVRQAIRDIAPDHPIFAVTTMPELITTSTADRRLILSLLGAFAGLALLLYGVQVTDVPTLLGVVATLALVCLLALWIPARRALRTDPALALREQ